jgi:pimeloyl-ACP methyl ester carboxylesterase
MTEVKPPSDVSMLTVSANGLNIHYQQTGSGPQVILIHGLTGSLADWQFRVVPMLAAQFTVLTYDLRGHGYSDMPPSGYTTADMASDLAGLLDALGIERAHIAGHSFGGSVALHFAALHPDRVAALTVSDSRVRSLQPSQKIKDWAHWPAWKEQLEKQKITLDEESELDFATLPLLFSQRAALRAKDSIASDRRREEHWNQLLSSTTANADLRDVAGLTPELIDQIRMPAQAIYGEFSFCLPTLEGLKQHLQGLKVAILPGVGHFFPITRPELFVQHIKAFHLPETPEPQTKDTHPENLQSHDPGFHE